MAKSYAAKAAYARAMKEDLPEPAKPFGDFRHQREEIRKRAITAMREVKQEVADLPKYQKRILASNDAKVVTAFSPQEMPETIATPLGPVPVKENFTGPQDKYTAGVFIPEANSVYLSMTSRVHPWMVRQTYMTGHEVSGHMLGANVARLARNDIWALSEIPAFRHAYAQDIKKIGPETKEMNKYYLPQSKGGMWEEKGRGVNPSDPHFRPREEAFAQAMMHLHGEPKNEAAAKDKADFIRKFPHMMAAVAQMDARLAAISGNNPKAQDFQEKVAGYMQEIGADGFRFNPPEKAAQSKPDMAKQTDAPAKTPAKPAAAKPATP